MKENRSLSLWVDAGYDVFAREGIEGLQIERLARIVGLNKSSFYYFFGDLEIFCDHLLTLHKKNSLSYLAELRQVESVEPDYLNLLVKYKTPVLVQMQLTRNKENCEFQKTVELVNRQQDLILNDVWCQYLDVDKHSNVGMRYFNIVRDTFYFRVTFQNYSYELLQSVLNEARIVLNDFRDQNILIGTQKKSTRFIH